MSWHGADEVQDSTGKASTADGLASHNQIALHAPEHRGDAGQVVA